MEKQLRQYRQEMQQELESILDYWITHAIDHISGGFIGRIDHAGNKYNKAPKGAVLNCRILWTFSAAFNHTGKNEYLDVARKAFGYIRDHFIDKDFGGVYWTVDYLGNPLDTKKQVYALSFALYALSEYYKATRDDVAKEQAVAVYKEIVRHSYDKCNGGYIEATTRDWKKMDDLRLSARDANERKSMNTHLHLLEGFSNLYSIWPDQELKQHIAELVKIFLSHIISEKGNLVLFFDDHWNRRSEIISYGHDIEAAWLLREAAEKLDDEELVRTIKSKSLAIARAAAQGLDADGGLWYEFDENEQHLVREKHWWPQAEAMVGFFNAWQLDNAKEYLHHSLRAWEFVKNNIRDKHNGEWYWGIHEGGIMDHEDKVGIWKCPYHNSRACMEIINRIDSVIDNN